MAGTVDHISPSQVGMWRRCPKQWMFRYVDKIFSPPGVALLLGSAYHTALETNFLQKIQSGQDLPLKDTLDAFSDGWDTYRLGRAKNEEGDYVEFDRVEWGDDDSGKVKDTGLHMVKTYMEEIAPSVRPVTVEQQLNVQVGNLMVEQRADLLTDEYVLVDHKTAARKMVQSDADRELQPISYMLGMRRVVPFQFHVAVKIKKPYVDVVNVRKTTDDMSWYIRILLETRRAMESGIFPPNDSGWWCSEKYCGYWKMCKGKGRKQVG